MIRFRRRIRLVGGVHLNLGLTGASLSVGRCGIGTTFGARGTTFHAGVPGTGIYWVQRAARVGTPYESPEHHFALHFEDLLILLLLPLILHFVLWAQQ